MTRARTLRHEFVSDVPSHLAEDVLYVSLEDDTALHLCCCGCRREVVTPLSPTDWRITYDGQTVSMCPSIGNWSFPCRSHYWIDRGRVQWSADWTTRQIEQGRDRDRLVKEAYYDDHPAADASLPREPEQPSCGVAIRALRALRALIDMMKDKIRD